MTKIDTPPASPATRAVWSAPALRRMQAGAAEVFTRDAVDGQATTS